jgi:Zn-dependent M28 family amino/carboxypeptidase
MLGRMTGSPGSARAAALIAERMQRAGLEPGGDSGFFQRVPLVRGGRSPILAQDWAARDTFPRERWVEGANVVGVLPGGDPAVRDEIVLVTAHYDHVGVRPLPDSVRRVNPDSIWNGADDNASGVVTVLEIARLLTGWPRPRRTVVFAALTGEELGGLGTRWYLRHPVRPLDRTVANLNIEMVGRPDSLAGGPGKAWLTGYERSTMGDALKAGGIPIVPDPRPSQDFFRRSDNYVFALQGIPAHTLSSYNMHIDYHRPSDEADRVDYAHMAAVIEAAARAARLLADGLRPEWHPGGRPEAVSRD